MRSLALVLLLAVLPARAEAPAPASFAEVLAATLPALAPDARDRIRVHVDQQAEALAQDLSAFGPADEADVRALLEARVRARLHERQGLATSEEEALHAVVDFEVFRARAFVSSGVFPKRYVGFFDAQGDSAALELRVVRAVQASTAVCNAWLEEQGIAWRATEKEIAVTWVAEGGALLLTTQQRFADRVHPILGIGLDDIAHGFKELPGLVGRLDEAAGTRVEGIPRWEDGDWTLTRNMTLEETVVGTAIMWVWEKRIAARKLKNDGRAAMGEHSADDQFILGSLVYNSGILHSASRPGQVRRYALAEHLADLARTHNGRRAHLPVGTSAQSLAALLVDRDYPEQGTSWIALYHILQRYGGFDGLSRTTRVFDADGRFVPGPWDALEARLAREAKEAEQAEAQAAEAERVGVESAKEAAPARGCGCASGGLGPGAYGPLFGLLVVVRRRGAPNA